MKRRQNSINKNVHKNDTTLKSLIWAFDRFEESKYKSKKALDDLKNKIETALTDGYPIDFFHNNICYSVPFLHFVLSEGYLPDPNPCKEEYFDIVNFLLDKKANVNIIDNNGWNALMYASHYQGLLMPKELFARIAAATDDVNYVIDDYPFMDGGPVSPDTTALKLLALNYINSPEELKEGCWENIKVLIDAGANIGVLTPNDIDYFGDLEHRREDYNELIRLTYEYAHREQIAQLENNTQDYCVYDYQI